MRYGVEVVVVVVEGCMEICGAGSLKRKYSESCWLEGILKRKIVTVFRGGAFSGQK